MKILNVRFGGSTNSSSTHSIVFGNGSYELPRERIPYENILPYMDDSFGWEDFKLNVLEEKIAYAYRQMYQIIQSDDKHNIYIALKGIFERYIDFPEYIEWLKLGNGDGCVDHQSVVGIKDYDFASKISFVDMLLDPKCVVYGGNDNTYRREIPGEIFLSDIAKVRKSGTKTYTIFDEWTGNKVRLGEEITKGAFPELVDMKITDYCNKGCSFCYQNSTKKGKHAKIEDINEYINILKSIGTFEVVIGGGEPTTHPRFGEILQNIKNAGMIPNFTTAAGDWVNNYDLVGDVMDTNARVGVSVTSEKDIKILENIVEKIGKLRVVVHMPFGVNDVDTTIDLVNKASNFATGVLFLGWKDCGRGKPLQPLKDYAMIFPIMKKYVEHNVIDFMSVDTSIVDTPEFKKVLDSLDINDILYASPEGSFSMYIDAVENRIGPSSYAPEKMVDFDDINKYYTVNKIGEFLEKWENM